MWLYNILFFDLDKRVINQNEIKLWLVDFNSMTTCLRLSSASKLRNDCHCIFMRINFLFIVDIFVLILVVYFFYLFIFLCCFFFHYVSAKFHLWPSSGDLPRPRIGMLSLVTISPVITAFHSCCLSHHVFDQVNLWPAWVGFETAIFWQCSPGTVETQCLYLLRHGPRRKNKTKMRTKSP